MRVMFCSDFAYPYIGGAESYIINLASRLVKMGHEVHWLSIKLPSTKSFEVYKGIYIHRIQIPFPQHYLFPGRQLFPLIGILPAIKLAKKMDILQFSTFVGGTFGGIIAKVTKKPTILFCHEMFGELWKLVGQNLFEKNVYPLVEKYITHLSYDWFIVPSQYSKKTLIKVGACSERISVIPHGIDFSLFHPKISGKWLRKRYGLENKKVVGYTGRLAIRGSGQSKNLLLLLDAMKLVTKSLPEVVLLLGGTEFHQLRPFIDSELRDYVLYIGERPHYKVPEFIRACDLIVCPALADGFCFLLAEAAACGKPTVATKRGAHPERILEKKTGILSEISPQSLAEGILKLLLNEKLLKKYGSNAFKYAKKFTWEKSVKEHLQIYEKLLQ